MITDTFHLRGALRIQEVDPSGRIVNERIINNLCVTQGRSWVLGQLQTVNQQTAQTLGWIAVGSVTIAPTTADTTLGGEVTRLPVASYVTTGLTLNPPSWQATVGFATNQANTTIAEMGIFNSSAGGTMLGHATFASFVKATSNTLNISYTLSA